MRYVLRVTVLATYVMDLPQKKDPKDARPWEEEVREFATFIERETKVDLTDENLAQAIQTINNKRLALSQRNP